MTDLIIHIAAKLGTSTDKLLLYPRIAKIIAHYRRAIATGRMTVSTAIDRAHGDICGCNRFDGKDQRSEPRYW